MRSLLRGRRGQSLVESALVLLAAVLAITAILDLAQVLMFTQFANERVRAAARYGAVHPSDAAAIANYAVYNSPSGPSGGGAGLMGLNPGDVTVVRHGAGTASDRIEVSIDSLSLHFLTPVIGGVKTAKPIRVVVPVENPA